MTCMTLHILPSGFCHPWVGSNGGGAHTALKVMFITISLSFLTAVTVEYDPINLQSGVHSANKITH